MSDRSPTIRDEVAEFNVGFAETIRPDLSAVFAGEQADLNSAGIPVGTAQIGDPVPVAELLDTEGVAVELGSLLAEGPAVLVFYRGAWCPYCNITLRHYNNVLAGELAAAGVKLIAISPQTPEGSRELLVR